MGHAGVFSDAASGRKSMHRAPSGLKPGTVVGAVAGALSAHTEAAAVGKSGGKTSVKWDTRWKPNWLHQHGTAAPSGAHTGLCQGRSFFFLSCFQHGPGGGLHAGPLRTRRVQVLSARSWPFHKAPWSLLSRGCWRGWTQHTRGTIGRSGCGGHPVGGMVGPPHPSTPPGRGSAEQQGPGRIHPWGWQ